MVHINGNKILIELETPEPEKFYKCLLKDIPTCLQAIIERGMDERDLDLPDSLFNMLELYKAILPTGKQIDRMLKKEK
jgi:hypothetical protein